MFTDNKMKLNIEQEKYLCYLNRLDAFKLIKLEQSKQVQKGLINCYDARIALSATPKRHFDDDGTSLIEDYFN